MIKWLKYPLLARMVSTPGVTYKMFRGLADEKINILAISTSEIKLSVIIDEENTLNAVKLHNFRFRLKWNCDHTEKLKEENKKNKSRKCFCRRNIQNKCSINDKYSYYRYQRHYKSNSIFRRSWRRYCPSFLS